MAGAKFRGDGISRSSKSRRFTTARWPAVFVYWRLPDGPIALIAPLQGPSIGLPGRISVEVRPSWSPARFACIFSKGEMGRETIFPPSVPVMWSGRNVSSAIPCTRTRPGADSHERVTFRARGIRRRNLRKTPPPTPTILRLTVANVNLSTRNRKNAKAPDDAAASRTGRVADGRTGTTTGTIGIVRQPTKRSGIRNSTNPPVDVGSARAGILASSQMAPTATP